MTGNLEADWWIILWLKKLGVAHDIEGILLLVDRKT
jgi:hypothetical protein